MTNRISRMCYRSRRTWSTTEFCYLPVKWLKATTLTLSNITGDCVPAYITHQTEAMTRFASILISLQACSVPKLKKLLTTG